MNLSLLRGSLCRPRRRFVHVIPARDGTGRQTALIAGALLAFALSFDEIIVTNFLSGPGVQTLPIWIFSNYSRPNQLPLVNVAAVIVLVLSIIPVYLASRLMADPVAVLVART